MVGDVPQQPDSSPGSNNTLGRIVEIVDGAKPIEPPVISPVEKRKPKSRSKGRRDRAGGWGDVDGDMTARLPPDVAEKFLRFTDPVRTAPPAQRLDLFGIAAQRVFALVGADFPRSEAVDRLQMFADAMGLAASDGVDAVQSRLAAALASPFKPGEDDLTLDNGEGEEARPPEFSDEALALRFASRHANNTRYVAALGKWFIWDTERWLTDDTLYAFNLARRICRQAAIECPAEKTKVAIASAKTVAAVERLARADRRLAATVNQWDAHAELLNTPAGVVDLCTGDTRPSRPEDYFSKITGVSPNPDYPIPVWLSFLDRITAGDADLISFLKRLCGYGLTGSTREHALFFFWGTGANGKSVFLGTVGGCAGDYHRTSPVETFTASAGERHPTELAALRGARLVTAIETEEGRRWAESKIKSLTGGDRIAARFMRQDFFEFTPTFKLIIAGNHRPGLRSVDEAVRRRFHLVPFAVTIPEGERDGELPEKLKSEWPGVLAWMIAGAVEWQGRGLAPPAAVRVATAAYLEAEDALAAWIEEATERMPDAWESSTNLFRSWKSWADRTGEYVGSLKKFSQRLEDRGDSLGVRKGRNGHGQRGFYGLRIAKSELPGDAGADPRADEVDI
jgi:putative DNA primase/helicase